ncbi:MAG: aminotransferase class V-fold PLP-dependent enzyme [FCB group bacterium]|nr:aminotransferase class V-fold PLP-dependent enzyme [FCB group bacterium]
MDYRALKAEYLLDPAITYLNHGSFGACPKPVFRSYQLWQRKLELEPVQFVDKIFKPAISEARCELGKFIHCDPDDLVYFPNPTTALNTVIRSLKLTPGDEILSTDHEYGALERTWKYYCQKTGAKFVRRPVHLPYDSKEKMMADFIAGINPKTKVIFISEMTSMTAVIFPVKEICSKAKEAGIMTIIDGAHVPGHINLDLSDMQPDVYTGACHKWLSAPKGSSFLYVKKSLQPQIDPLVISWGWESDFPSHSQFLDYHQWQGTRDLSAFFAVPAAIAFQKSNNWQEVSSRCHNLLVETRRRISNITGAELICPDSKSFFGQMASIRLPDIDPVKIQTTLFQEYKIEVPVFRWKDETFIRVSIQAYNDENDVDKLIEALKQITGKQT